ARGGPRWVDGLPRPRCGGPRPVGRTRVGDRSVGGQIGRGVWARDPVPRPVAARPSALRLHRGCGRALAPRRAGRAEPGVGRRAMKAVVLAGGRGRRLRPLTFERPAALLPVANRPVVEYLLDHFARHRVDEATLILHHCPYPVERRLGDGTRWGLRLDYALERIPLGTAGGLRLVAGGWSEPFIVAAGTALTTSDLAKAAAFHRDREAALTMVVAAAPDGPVDVRLDEEGSLEAGAQGGRGFVSLGLAIVSPDAVALVPPRRRFDVLADLVPRLRAAGLPVWGYVSSEPGLVIRTPRELLVANRRALAGELPDLVLPGFEIAPRVRLCRGARVHPTAQLSPPVLIGVNAVVGRDAVVEAAVIGDDVIVEPGSTVRGSVVLPRTHL